MRFLGGSSIPLRTTKNPLQLKWRGFFTVGVPNREQFGGFLVFLNTGKLRAPHEFLHPIPCPLNPNHPSILRDLAASCDLHLALLNHPTLSAQLETVVEAVVNTLKKGGKILLAGNGGSAADAQHMAAEYVGRFAKHRRALPAVALTTDSSILTAVGNDYGYEQVFARQVEALGKEGDVLMVYSTSGSSPNILHALEAGGRSGLTRVGFGGQKAGAMGALCEHLLQVPSGDTPRIQEGHLLLGHIICGAVESALFPPSE